MRLIESSGEVYREASKLVANVRERCEGEQDARKERDAAFASVPSRQVD